MLCDNSGADLEWLMDVFNLDLSLISRLGLMKEHVLRFLIRLAEAEFGQGD